MCFLPLKSSHYPSRPVPVPELFGKYPTRPVPKSKTPTRQTLEGNQNKENHPHTISKMMGTSVHVQLYTFSNSKAEIRPQNMPKPPNWG